MTSIYGTVAPSSSNLGVELPPSQRFGPMFACLDDKEALKEHPQLAFKDVIFDACTKADERNAYIVKLLRECLRPEWFQQWERERTNHNFAQQQRQQERKQPQGSTAQPSTQEHSCNWMAPLTLTKDGKLKNTLHNVCEIFRNEYRGRLSYNEMSKTHCLDGQAYTTDQLTQIREQIEIRFEITPGAETAVRAFDSVAYENKFHPVRKYLHSLPQWDGVKRWEQIPHQAVFSNGTPDAAYWKRWGISAIARIMNPGCKAETSLILSGTQGFLKSTAFKELAGKEFFIDSSADIEGKEWVQEFHKRWVIEWAELERVTTKKGCDVVKAFQSKEHDDYRPPYAIKSEQWSRQFVVVGTTNKEEFLVDPSGSRRFWVIRVLQEIHLPFIRENRNWLWAEALHNYQLGEQWHLTKEEDQQREQSNAAYEERDVWEETIHRWLLRNNESFYTTEAVLSGALEKPTKDRTKRDKERVEATLEKLGWKFTRPHVGDTRVRGWTQPK